MTLSMSQAIAQCPHSMFGKKGERPPNYPGIFAAVAKALLADAKVKFSEATIDAVAEIINPSTLQRQIAQHRESLTGKWDADRGEFEPIPEKKPRVKMAPRGVDPVTGEKTGKTRSKGKKGAKGTPPGEANARKVTKTKTTKAKKGETASPAKEGTADKLKKGIAKPASNKPAKAPQKGKEAAPGGDRLSALAKARAALAAKKPAKVPQKTAPVSTEVDDDDVI